MVGLFPIHAVVKERLSQYSMSYCLTSIISTFVYLALACVIYFPLSVQSTLKSSISIHHVTHTEFSLLGHFSSVKVAY